MNKDIMADIEGGRPREAIEWIVSYWYNANEDRLPRVMLIGDSICNGYQEKVRDELAGTAYVSFYAGSKCVTDRSYLRELAYMLEEYEYEVIHFNNGLHSLTTPGLQRWKDGLRAALQLIREKGRGAKIIWASSTPVNDPALAGRVEKLNAIALEVMRENNIPVNDLFALMDPLERDTYWVDPYHYNDDGKKMQAIQVANAILEAMGKKRASDHDAEASLKATATATGPDGKITTR